MNLRALQNFLIEKKIKQCELAKASKQLYPSVISSVLRGWHPVGEKLKEKFYNGLVNLGFSTEELSHIFKKE